MSSQMLKQSETTWERWDGVVLESLPITTYGDYLLKKVGKVFPDLREEVLTSTGPEVARRKQMEDAHLAQVALEEARNKQLEDAQSLWDEAKTQQLAEALLEEAWEKQMLEAQRAQELYEEARKKQLEDAEEDSPFQHHSEL